MAGTHTIVWQRGITRESAGKGLPQPFRTMQASYFLPMMMRPRSLRSRSLWILNMMGRCLDLRFRRRRRRRPLNQRVLFRALWSLQILQGKAKVVSLQPQLVQPLRPPGPLHRLCPSPFNRLALHTLQDEVILCYRFILGTVSIPSRLASLRWDVAGLAEMDPISAGPAEMGCGPHLIDVLRFKFV